MKLLRFMEEQITSNLGALRAGLTQAIELISKRRRHSRIANRQTSLV